MTYNGGLVGSLNTPDTSTASGVWSVTDHALYTKAESWLQEPEGFNNLIVYYINGDSLVDKTGRHSITANGSAGISSVRTSPVTGNRSSTNHLYAGTNTSSNIVVSDNLSDFDWGTGDWTVEYWIQDPASTGRYYHTFVADGQNSKGVFKGFSDSNSSSRSYSQYFYSSSGGGLGAGNQTIFPIDTWTHLAFERRADDATGWAYVNGNLVHTLLPFTVPGGVPTSASHGYWNTEYSQFFFDEFIVTRASKYGGQNFTPSTNAIVL